MEKQDAYLEELEQQRAQWREEVRQMRNEEEQRNFQEIKSLAPFCTVILFCCITLSSTSLSVLEPMNT